MNEILVLDHDRLDTKAYGEESHQVDREAHSKMHGHKLMREHDLANDHQSPHNRGVPNRSLRPDKCCLQPYKYFNLIYVLVVNLK